MTGTSLRDALTRDLAGAVNEPAERLARRIVEAFGHGTAAIIHYGSHAQGSGGRPDSAYDFFVIVEHYAAAYESFVSHMQPRFGARTATMLAHVLPPNVVAITLRGAGEGEPLVAKCAVLSEQDLAAACSRDSSDHFTKGRLFQQVQLAWTRDPSSRAAVVDALATARAGTFEWGRPYLPVSFNADSYCRTLLTTSYSAEIRPETSARVAEVFTAQRRVMVAIYDALLENLVERGVLARRAETYTQLRRAKRLERLRVSLYFSRSKLRATLRWGKHIWLYDDWLEYIRQKVARRSGTVIELTPRERRWPLIFLWPKAIRYLRTRR
ncbi:hypothetical protein BH23GEM2_BH23GEM2_05170 [soil metagenome]